MVLEIAGVKTSTDQSNSVTIRDCQKQINIAIGEPQRQCMLNLSEAELFLTHLEMAVRRLKERVSPAQPEQSS